MDQKIILIDSESVVANLASRWIDRIYDGSKLQILFSTFKTKILPFSWKYLFIIQSGSRYKAVGYPNLKAKIIIGTHLPFTIEPVIMNKDFFLAPDPRVVRMNNSTPAIVQIDPKSVRLFSTFC